MLDNQSSTSNKEAPGTSIPSTLNKLVEKYSNLSEKLDAIAVYLGKVESEKKTSLQEKDRLVHRIQQLELELKNNLQAGDELIAQNTEYCKPRANFSGKNGAV